MTGSCCLSVSQKSHTCYIASSLAIRVEVWGVRRAESRMDKNQTSFDPAALLCPWRDVRGHCPAENEKLTSRCCANLRKQHLAQNDVKAVSTIDFYPCLSLCMCYPVWIYCCKRPHHNFCISQGSVATVLRWGGPNCNHLRRVFLRCCTQKIESANISRSYSKNNTGTIFWDTV